MHALLYLTMKLQQAYRSTQEINEKLCILLSHIGVYIKGLVIVEK
jgi:hypothetical protein